MILILGSTHDDILYFESVMTNKKEETIFDIYKATFGAIFNQEVVVVHNLYTSYESAIVTDYILQKYFVVLVFVVGKCIGYSDTLKAGDICISRRVILGDVDQIKEANVKLGQIPNQPRSFESSEEVLGFLSSALEQRSFSRYSHTTIISTNGVLDRMEKIAGLVMSDYVLGHKTNVVFDCTSGGSFFACSLNRIPVVSIKVIERMINEPSSADSYINVLKQYSGVGRAVVTCIGDIGRNDIVRE